MSRAPAERAGMAASLEEVAIELGGAIGITVLGSILAGVYAATVVLPGDAVPGLTAADGIDHVLAMAGTLPAEAAQPLIQAARTAFDNAYLVALAVNAALLAAVAALAWRARS